MDAKLLADIREDYRLAELDEGVTGTDPLHFFRHWFGEAVAAEISEVNAMTLATADAAGKPHARIVLLKGLDDRGFTFYTNLESAKGRELGHNPYASLVFFWKELERQVRIEGIAEPVSAADSDAYFASRPAGSRIGAWSSPQSSVIAGRQILEDRVRHYAGLYATGDIPRPAFWGGYRIVPGYIEFWQGRSNRLHDRIAFRRQDTQSPWERVRLAP